MSDERKEIVLPDVEIDSSILEKFEALDDAVNRNPWTEKKDKLLLMYWPIKKHEDVAKLLQLCTATCLKRYRQLTEA